jgi:hypothetical protein
LYLSGRLCMRVVNLMSDLSLKPKPNNAPTYMCLYPGLAEIARANGYALAVHGSLARDMDLIAVPWVESPATPEQVISTIEATYGIERIGGLTAAPHGRLVQTIGIKFGECFIDLSFMPITQSPLHPPQSTWPTWANWRGLNTDGYWYYYADEPVLMQSGRVAAGYVQKSNLCEPSNAWASMIYQRVQS